jgi:hypothetical protein
MKSFTKKCRGCLWPGPRAEEGLEAVPADVVQAAGLLLEVLDAERGVVS